MSRSTRLFELIQILRSAKKPLTAQAIASELEVNKRTVYRDIAELQAMRVPVQGEAGIGYVMRQGYDLPPLMFNAEELEALMLGLTLLGRTGDAAIQKTAQSVSRKIADVVPSEQRSRVVDSHLLASVWHVVPESEVNPQLVRHCIRDELALAFDYCDKHQSRTHRTASPVALLYYIDVVIVAAWCDLRSDFRHFRLDRMHNCSVVDTELMHSGTELRQRWRAQHDLSLSGVQAPIIPEVFSYGQIQLP